ncbi:MAG: ATP-binding protein [Planctomycetota bacterium]
MPAPDGPDLRLSLNRDPAELGRLALEVEAFLGKHPELGASGYAVQLTLEELVSNVIRHADTDETDLTIDVSLQLADDGIRILVEDDGPAFDPLAVPSPDTEAPIDERSIGGLGIHLVRNVATDLAYARREQRNCLSLRIPLQD